LAGAFLAGAFLAGAFLAGALFFAVAFFSKLANFPLLLALPELTFLTAFFIVTSLRAKAHF
jgi:hypothetical protein